MERYEVITYDDQKAGHVVGREGSYLVIEHGAIFKHRRPVPETFVTVDDEAQVVRLTVSREILESAPEVEDGVVAQPATDVHYGLADGPPRDDELGLASDREAAERELERQSGERLGRGQGSEDRPVPSPGVTGGDRYRDRHND